MSNKQLKSKAETVEPVSSPVEAPRSPDREPTLADILAEQKAIHEAILGLMRKFGGGY